MCNYAFQIGTTLTPRRRRFGRSSNSTCSCPVRCGLSTVEHLTNETLSSNSAFARSLATSPGILSINQKSIINFILRNKQSAAARKLTYSLLTLEHNRHLQHTWVRT